MPEDLFPYTGRGKRISERNEELREKYGESAIRIETPPYEGADFAENADKYYADDGLRAAVNVALLLGLPLLITGEPGTGKTQLAWSIAHELELPRRAAEADEQGAEGEAAKAGGHRPFIFHTKTTSSAKDLFYRYDALRHFQDIQLNKMRPRGADAIPEAVAVSRPLIDIDAESPSAEQQEAGGLSLPVSGNGGAEEVRNYITFEALGLAILLAMEPGEVGDLIPANLRFERPTRSVVLIDEIDKAPRDLPNDILHEIEELSFEVKEMNRSFKASKDMRPIVVLTSNSEKNLPDAFLRRCVFYNINFPDNETDLRRIIGKRLAALPLDEDKKSNAINSFLEIRKLGLRKRPATAELIVWLRLLESQQLDVGLTANREKVIDTFSVLAKNKDDWELMVKNWEKIVSSVSAASASKKTS
jgi:MoxR-like ATPase